MTTKVQGSPRRTEALGLAEQLAEEATSPRGVYEVPIGYARIRAARLGIGREGIRKALDRPPMRTARR